MIGRLYAVTLAMGTMMLAGSARAGEKQLIPRNVLFGNPDHASVQISHDGKQISYLAPVDGVINVWVAPIDKLDAAKAITHDTKRGIRQYSWAYTNSDILYLQDQGGDENWAVHRVDLKTGEDKTLTPAKDVNAQIDNVSEKFPDEILVNLNDRSPMFHDLHRINIKTGQDKVVLENPGMIDNGMVVGLMTDDNFVVRYAATMTMDGGSAIFKPKEAKDPKDAWEKVETIPMEDMLNTQPLGFDKSGQILYMSDSRGRDTSALYAVDLKSGEKKLLAEDSKADAGGILQHPTNHTAQAVSFTYDKRRWQILDPAIAPDLEYLKTLAGAGEFNVNSRTLDDKAWIVACISDAGPVKYYRYDRDAKKAQFLFTNNKALENLTLAKMTPAVVKSRDGLNLVCYYTLPPSEASKSGDVPKPSKPLPTVLLVHGGPWARDDWGYDPMHQWLANRGYAVLSVNFRGSTGLGKKFVNAGNKEWGAKMHDDLLDAVNWAVEQKIADPKKVAIMGGSYGGYATLVGLTMTPEQFACGVDICGPSRIATLMDSVPPYWMPAMKMFTTRVGDNGSEAGRKFLDSRSPLTYVDKIQKPLLIGQGANDPRVKQTEADQIVKAMKDKSLPVTYVLYSDEGHGFARPENRLSFFAVAEAFLSQHIGGAFQPVDDDFKNSTIKVQAGAEQVPGIKEKAM